MVEFNVDSSQVWVVEEKPIKRANTCGITENKK